MLKEEVSVEKAFINILKLTDRFQPIFSKHNLQIKRDKIPTVAEEIFTECIQNASKHYKNVFAVLTSNEDMIEFSDQNSDLLYLATEIGKIEVIAKLLNSGADINYVEGYWFILAPHYTQ